MCSDEAEKPLVKHVIEIRKRGHVCGQRTVLAEPDVGKKMSTILETAAPQGIVNQQDRGGFTGDKEATGIICPW